MKLIDIDALLDEEIVELDKEPLLSLLTLVKELSESTTPKTKAQASFVLTHFRMKFAKKKLVKNNKMNFVWPKYLYYKLPYFGRSQLIDGFVFNDCDEFISILSSQIIKSYVLIHDMVYQKNTEFKLEFSEFINYAMLNNIRPIIDFQKKKNLNDLILNFYSFINVIEDAEDYSYSIHGNFKFQLSDKINWYYNNCYRGKNEILPLSILYQEKPETQLKQNYTSDKAIVILKNDPWTIIDYGICLVLNSFVLFKKALELIQFKK